MRKIIKRIRNGFVEWANREPIRLDREDGVGTRLKSRDITPGIRATSADHEWVERYLREEQASCSSED